MMRINLLLPWCLLALSASATAQDLPAVVNLQPHFVANQTARYEVWTLRDQSITVDLAGKSQTIATRMEVTGEVSWTVDRVSSDGSADCLMTIEWLAARLTTPEGVQVCDSRRASGDNEAVQRLLQSMSGAPLRMSVAADGTVGTVRGVEAIRQRAGDAVQVPEDLEFIETASDLATIPYAPAQLGVGQNFSARFAWPHELGTLHHESSYRLASVEEVADIPLATIEGQTRLTLQPNPGKLPPNSPPMDIRLLSGNANSQVMFDLLRREAVGRNSIQTTQVRVSMSVQNQTLTRTVDETIQSQVLRIQEQ